MTGIGLAKASLLGLVLQVPLCKGRRVLRNWLEMGKYRRVPAAGWQMLREGKIKLCRREGGRKAPRRRGRGKAEERARGEGEMEPERLQPWARGSTRGLGACQGWCGVVLSAPIGCSPLKPLLPPLPHGDSEGAAEQSGFTSCLQTCFPPGPAALSLWG